MRWHYWSHRKVTKSSEHINFIQVYCMLKTRFGIGPKDLYTGQGGKTMPEYQSSGNQLMSIYSNHLWSIHGNAWSVKAITLLAKDGE